MTAYLADLEKRLADKRASLAYANGEWRDQLEQDAKRLEREIAQLKGQG